MAGNVVPIRRSVRMRKQNRKEDAGTIQIAQMAAKANARAYELAQTEPNSERHLMAEAMTVIDHHLPRNKLRCIAARGTGLAEASDPLPDTLPAVIAEVRAFANQAPIWLFLNVEFESSVPPIELGIFDRATHEIPDFGNMSVIYTREQTRTTSDTKSI